MRHLGAITSPAPAAPQPFSWNYLSWCATKSWSAEPTCTPLSHQQLLPPDFQSSPWSQYSEHCARDLVILALLEEVNQQLQAHSHFSNWTTVVMILQILQKDISN